MKKLIVLFVLVIFVFPGFAQFNGSRNYGYPMEGQGRFQGGLGMNWIDGKLNYTLHLAPEFSFNNWGLGLDLQLTFDQEGKFRKENYNEFTDYLSIIRYVRYGLKNDPVYVRVGALIIIL